MSMHNGFESEIRTRLLGTTSHITIFPLGNELIDIYPELVDTLEKFPGVEAASPFIYYKAAISSASAGDGIIIRGIDLVKEKQTSQIEQNIKVGDCSFDLIIDYQDTIPGMIIGSNLADRLGVFLGSSVVLYSLRGEDLMRRARPRVAKFYISGIFETGMYEFDANMAYISLTDAQELFRTGDAVTAVHLRLDDIYKAEHMAPIIDSGLGHKYDVVPWNILHKNLFTWIAIEKKMLFLGFILIVLVAAFSIISTLVMLTMQKRSEIGILKTIGSTPASVRKIFVYKGLVIASFGVVIGWVIALFCAFLQNHYEIITLPADIYFISYLPIETHLLDFLLAGVVTFIICFLASLYPALQAARLSVIDVLRQ
jgi:lipoprotein-releasing system permease protein